MQMKDFMKSTLVFAAAFVFVLSFCAFARSQEVAEPDGAASAQSADGWSSPDKAGARMEIEIEGVKTAFRWAPPGSFKRRWSKGTERFWEKQTDWDDDKIDYKITLTQGFWLAETETTQDLWEAVMGENPSEGARSGKTPVNNMSWEEMQEFISKLNDGGYAPNDFEFRLPTEAQWEYACLAGWTKEVYGELNDIAWYSKNSEGLVHEVGQKQANAWGLYDMIGNVWEWCSDWYGKFPNQDLTDYDGPLEGSVRVYRGCSCRSNVWDSEYNRNVEKDLGVRSAERGFRFALVPKERNSSKKVSAADGDSAVTDVKKPTSDDESPTQSADGWSFPCEAGARMEVEIKSVKTAFRWAPPGSFTRPLNKTTEPYWEEPTVQFEEIDYKITVARGFWLAETETTQELWEAVMGENPSKGARTGKSPVNFVSWDDTQEFISKLNSGGYAPAGFEFRLPTEAQWEYACMAGSSGERYGELDAIAWHGGNLEGRPSEVGQKLANAWGLYDMLGNVAEWCNDWYERYPNRDLIDYVGPQRRRPYHVIRGSWDSGGWAPSMKGCSRSFRDSGDAGDLFTGFRLALVSKDLTSHDKAGARIVFEIDGVKVAFRWCPPGSFTRQWNKWTKRWWEEPVEQIGDKHDFKITLTQGFWLAETETTQEFWEAVTGRNPSLGDRSGSTPVNNISVTDVQDFISKLNDGGYTPGGFEFRLPTEAQWEYACAAGSTGERYGKLNTIAWHAGNSDGRAHEVGLKEPNAWGFYDMLGNVWEWCCDEYEKYPMMDLTDYAGPREGSFLVIRGAGWYALSELCSRYTRGNYGGMDDNFGFRLAIVPKDLICVHDVFALDDVASLTGDKALTQCVEAWSSASEAGARNEVEIEGVRAAFRWCPPGSFMRHWTEAEESNWQEPTTWVGVKQDFEITLTRGFWLAETETTQELWKAVTGENPSEGVRTRKRPVNNVSWDDAQEFISKLNAGGYAPNGFEFRLPTEAQWEYACLAGRPIESYALGWGWSRNMERYVYEVGKYKANAWGLYDMLGNAWEWCCDWYAEYPLEDLTDYSGPQEGSIHIYRGGAEATEPSDRFLSGVKSVFHGFRLALVPKEE